MLTQTSGVIQTVESPSPVSLSVASSKNKIQ